MNIISFEKANSLVREKKFSDAIYIYKKLIANNLYFKYYAKNAALASEKIGLYNDAAIFYLQSYFANRENKYIRLASTKIKERNLNNDNLVLVVIPAFNAERTIVESVKSVLNQEHKKIMLVVIDDASTDRTYELLVDLQCKDMRINIIKNTINKGPFYSVNIGLFLFRWIDFDYFIKHDADDIMLPLKLKLQIDLLEKNKAKYFCTSGYERLDFVTKEIIGGKKFGHNMTLYRCDVFRKIGYFDCNRFGSDSEYLERAFAAYGEDSNIHLNERLTQAYLMDTGITNGNPLASDLKKKYQKKFKLEHSIMSNFSYFNRSFDLFDELILDIKKEKPIVCGIATLYIRRDSLKDTIESIIHQVDKLFVYQNDYKEIFDFLVHDKISVISALDTGVNMGDAGKYYMVGNYKNAYYFSIDDDLIYPRNYVDHLIDLLSKYDGKVIVTAHGRVSKSNAKSYYNDKLEVFHFNGSVPKLSEIHFGGTGVMAFDTKNVNITFDDFKHPNMADIWMGLHAQRNNIPILVPPHSDNWIIHSSKFDINTTIFRASKEKNSSYENAKNITDEIIRGVDLNYINAIEPSSGLSRKAVVIKPFLAKYFISIYRTIAIAIPTFNRMELLIRLVRQLDEAAKYFNVHLFIFDDGSRIPIHINFFKIKNIKNIEIIRFSNHGKKRYWVLVNKIFDRLSLIKSDYYFYLGDDLEVNSNFFVDALTQWESIDDPNKMSLNLLRDTRTKSWTDFERIEKKFGDFIVFQTQWLDMIMVFDKKFLLHRVHEIPLSRWSKRPLLSSGVGAQLSSRFHQLGFGMYQVLDSLVRHGTHESEMNPEERKLNPLITI